jgi:hypothetical protein
MLQLRTFQTFDFIDFMDFRLYRLFDFRLSIIESHHNAVHGVTENTSAFHRLDAVDEA